MKKLGAATAMMAVAVLCAFFAMRMAIHGREVDVPNLAGKSDADAASAAKDLGLNLSVENRFYSAAMAPNHVLSQSPAAGSRVRRGWQVRVTESLGGQKVQVPDVTGQTERPAGLVLRRLQLEVGTVAHLPAPEPAGVVLAQSPPPNTVGLNGPQVALLVSDVAEAPETVAFVMPQITGMSLGNASARLATVGLHIASAAAPIEVVPEVVNADGSVVGDAVAVAPAPPPEPVSTSAMIVGQTPAAGKRVSRADAIRVTLAR